MKSKLLAGLLLICFCIVLFSSCSAAAVSPDNGGSPEISPETDASSADPADGTLSYRIEKLKEINDKILMREVVESSYFYYIADNEELLAGVERYNELTNTLTRYSVMRAASVMQTFLTDYNRAYGQEESNETEGSYGMSSITYFTFSEDTRSKINRMVKLSLYENSSELLSTDPEFAFILASEAGGSYGLWASHWYPNYIGLSDEYIKECFTEYFELEKTLYAQLEKAMS